MLGLLGAFLLRDLFNSLRIRINNTFEQNVIYDMRREVYARLQRLPVNYFDQRASGDLMTRVIEDVNSVERVLIDGTEQGTVALLSIVGVLAILFYTNPTLAWIALVPLPLLAGGALWYTLTAHRRYRAQRQAASAMNALLMDNLQGIRQIKAFGRRQHEDERFAQRADELRQGTLGVMRVWAMYSPGDELCGALGHGAGVVGGRPAGAGQPADAWANWLASAFISALFYEPIARLHGLEPDAPGGTGRGRTRLRHPGCSGGTGRRPAPASACASRCAAKSFTKTSASATARSESCCSNISLARQARAR